MAKHWTKANNPHVWKKQAAAKRRASAKKGSTAMAKKKSGSKRKSSGGKTTRRRGRRGAGGKWSMNRNDLLIAGGTALGYGYLQSKAGKATGDDMKWFKELPMITPLGRAGTIAAAGLGAYLLGGPKLLKPIGIGIAAVFLLGFGRRNLQLFDEAAAKDVLSGEDEMFLEGGGNGDGDDGWETGTVELQDENGSSVVYDVAA